MSDRQLPPWKRHAPAEPLAWAESGSPPALVYGVTCACPQCLAAAALARLEEGRAALARDILRRLPDALREALAEAYERGRADGRIDERLDPRGWFD